MRATSEGALEASIVCDAQWFKLVILMEWLSLENSMQVVEGRDTHESAAPCILSPRECKLSPVLPVYLITSITWAFLGPRSLATSVATGRIK
jgi:hypothetical protein